MSKMIRLTDEAIAEIKAEFDKALVGAIPDGKINFQKNIGTIQRKAELCFMEKAWLKMQTLIRECDKEVGWHGVAKRVDGEGDVYVIEDILVYPQTVTGTTVTPDQEQYQTWLMCHEDEIFNNIRMQGHSHVNMGVTPSGVDTTFYDQILKQLDDTMFYIFMIWNKRNERHIKIYDMAKNVLFETADVNVTIMEDDTGVQKFISDAKNMITEHTYTPPTKSAYQGATGYNQGPAYSGYGYGSSYGGNNYGGGYSGGYYRGNEPSSKPVTSTASALAVVKSGEKGEEPDAASKKNSKKKKLGDGRKRVNSVLPTNSSGSSAGGKKYGHPYSSLFDDDDPYGPFGYADEYCGYED